MTKLTDRQQQVFDLIQRVIEETGFPPTRAEIATKLGFRSTNAAEEHLKALARKGVIEMVPGASRGIRIVNESQGIPLVGQVAAGSPLLAEENIEDHCAIPHDFFHPRADYLLRVRGMSMKDIGIMDGDLLAVHKIADAQDGAIVVARIDNEVTVKKLVRNRVERCIELHPANDEFDVIRVDPNTQDFAIEGISVGVIRR